MSMMNFPKLKLPWSRDPRKKKKKEDKTPRDRAVVLKGKGGIEKKDPYAGRPVSVHKGERDLRNHRKMLEDLDAELYKKK